MCILYTEIWAMSTDILPKFEGIYEFWPPLPPVFHHTQCQAHALINSQANLLKPTINWLFFPAMIRLATLDPVGT
jgi:hypothetical protein